MVRRQGTRKKSKLILYGFCKTNLNKGQGLVMTILHISNVPCICEPSHPFLLASLTNTYSCEYPQKIPIRCKIISSLVSSSHSSAVFVYSLGHSAIWSQFTSFMILHLDIPPPLCTSQLHPS